MDVKFKLLDGQLPKVQTKGSAGYDLYSAVDICIPKKELKLVRLGFCMALEDGFEAQIRSRSGLALNKSVFVLNSPGTIDPDYRGEIAVILYNLGNEEFYIKKGDRIAQMIFAKFLKINSIIVENLFETERLGGFGSTKGL